MEKVAKREAEAEAEKKRVEERLKELRKEKERDELIRLGQAAGAVALRDTSLDWMYAGGVAARAQAETRDQEKASAAAPPLVPAPASTAPPGAPSLLPSFMQGGVVSSQNEMWRRMVNDPLVAIMQQEQQQRQAVRANPGLMMQIRQEVEQLKRGSSSGGAQGPSGERSKKEKKHKKEKKAGLLGELSPATRK